MLLLGSLSDSWETLVVSVNNSAPNEKLTLDIVIDRLQNEESMRNSVETVPSESDALVSEKQKRRGRSQSINSRQQNNDKPRGRSKSQRRNLKCFHCQKMGQIKRKCRLWKKEQVKENGDDQKNDKENTTTIVDGDLGIVYDESSVNLTCHTNDCVIDSGASFYVTSHLDYFTSYINGDYNHVRMGNEGASKIVGIGDICLETSIDCKLLLKDVKHVPDIRLNLTSTGKLDDDSYTNQFGERK